MVSAQHTLAPYIAVKGASDAIAFYEKAFGAKERFRLVSPTDGKIGHAEIAIGDAVFMLSDEHPDFGALSPETLGGAAVKLHLYVPDVDAMFKRALAAGATEVRALKDEFYGDRVGTVADPFGYVWIIATKIKEVAPEKMQADWNAAMGA